jgi:hypothetical protein
MFTAAAVQRAMNAKAARWGAPPGYYSVQERVKKLSFEEQVWDVRVRLFGGRTSHHEHIVFIRENYEPDGPIEYCALASRYEGPSSYKLQAKPEKTTSNGNRTPDSILEANQNVRRHLQEETLADALMSRTPWTHSEDEQIRIDAAKGIPISQTARKLGRTYFATGQRRVVIGAANPKAREGEARA